MVPSVQFCVSPHGRRLAYSSLGEGPILVLPPGWISHLGVLWEDARLSPLRDCARTAQSGSCGSIGRGAGFPHVIASDFSLDEDVLDLETVVAELPEQPLSLFAISCTGPVAVTFAARHPERVARLMLYGTFARGARVATKQIQRSVIDLVRASWGLGARLLTELFIPADSGAPREAADWFARFQRESASSRDGGAAARGDVRGRRHVRSCRSVRAPTMVLHRRRDRAISERAGRELAAGIAGARFVELEGGIHLAWMGDVDEVLRAIARFLGQPTPTLVQEREPVRYEVVTRNLLGDSADTQPRCRVGLAQIDVPFESFVPAGDGLVAMRSDAVPRIARQLEKMLERAAARRIELLLFPELFVDARLEALFAPLVDWARATGAYVVPGAFHVPETHASVCRVIGPTGILWEQEKHIPAIFTVDGRRSTEGIRGSARRRLAVADTRFGRIAVAICRDFLDLDLRVDLRNADPPVDIVLNPAFTPVTADFEAAHFEARRSLYAYCVFCNAARFGNSLISSPEKAHRRRRLPPGREALLVKDVDLLALRAARRHWETLRGPRPASSKAPADVSGARSNPRRSSEHMSGRDAPDARTWQCYALRARFLVTEVSGFAAAPCIRRAADAKASSPSDACSWSCRSAEQLQVDAHHAHGVGPRGQRADLDVFVDNIFNERLFASNLGLPFDAARLLSLFDGELEHTRAAEARADARVGRAVEL